MRILVVEDEPRLAKLIAKGLSEQAYAVDLAHTGEDALYKASINDYDAIVLDIMIPAPLGFEVCSELRSRGSSIPILMLTARDAVADRIAGLDSGADDYLIKPFEFGELLARIRALLRRSDSRGNIDPSPIRIADLTIDVRGRRVWRGERLIQLTTKEYALLDYLARERGRVVDRREIAEHVWNEEFDPFSNLIEVYINRLRRKLDEPFAKRLLHTRRGAGYVLTESAEGPLAPGQGEEKG